MTLSELIRKAEAERGAVVTRTELLESTLYRCVLAFIDLQRVREWPLNSEITIAFRGDGRGSLTPKANISMPTD